MLLVAGEASGDLQGATLARALAGLAPGLAMAGMGGPRMEAAGVRILHGIEHAAVVGGTEVFGRLPALLRIFRDLVGRLRAERPRVLVLIDFPEFNLRLARRARALGIPVVYFIPPQVWAWRPGRLRLMARVVSRSSRRSRSCIPSRSRPMLRLRPPAPASSARAAAITGSGSRVPPARRSGLK